MMRLLLAFALLTSQLYASRDFDGTDDYADCGDPADTMMTENGALSLSLWIRPDTNGELNLGRVFQRGALVWFFAGSATNALSFQVFGSTALHRRTSDNTITMNVWQHLVLTWDGSTTAANVHVYKNGTELGYLTTTNGVTPSNSTGNLFVGNNGTDAIRSYDGEIAQFAVWTGVLLANEISALANKVPPPRAVQSLPMQMWVAFGQASTEGDWSGQTNDCAITGAIVGEQPPVAPYFSFLKEKFDTWAGFLSGLRYAFGS